MIKGESQGRVHYEKGICVFVRFFLWRRFDEESEKTLGMPASQ